MVRQQFSRQEINQEPLDQESLVPTEHEKDPERFHVLLFSVLMSLSILTVALILIIVIHRIINISNESN